MMFQLLVPLVVIFMGSSYAQTTIPPAPPFHPPEKGRPSNMKDCRLNANAVLPWIVGVWDAAYRHFVGHGSMITYNTFVTTCRQYVASIQSYKAVGQHIWNFSLPEDPCMQVKSLKGISKHPKCIESRKMATFFDFSVITIENGWDITGIGYPTAVLASSPYDQLIGVQFINMVPDTTGCMLPHFKEQTRLPPSFDFFSTVESVKFHSKCVKLLCEKFPPNEAFSAMCQKRLGERAKGTMLCMLKKNRTTTNIYGVGPFPYWYAGTPLVCNATAYGMATQVKERQRFSSSGVDDPDIHFVVTFLRVWPWLMQEVKENTAPWKFDDRGHPSSSEPNPASTAVLPNQYLSNVALRLEIGFLLYLMHDFLNDFIGIY